MSSEQVRDSFRVSGRAMRRAATWLGRHGLAGATPSPLLATRLRVRRRMVAALAVVVLVIGEVLVLTWAGIGVESFQSGQHLVLSPFAYNTMFVLVVLAARWWGLHAVRRSDRRIGVALRRRVTHSTALSWRAVLGTRRLAVLAATYGAAMTIGIAAVMLGRSTEERLAVVVLVLGIIALAAMTVAEIVEIVCRPAVAEDAVSLAADDALRVDDARTVVASPLPVLLACLTVNSLPSFEMSVLVALCSVFLALLFVAVAWDQATHPPVALCGRTAPVGTS